jgi:hypothetical protein
MSVFGTNPDHLSRRDDPDTSHEAGHSINTTTLEWMMYVVICSYSSHGCIADELRAAYPSFSYSSVTARPCALERKGLITRGPDKRRGESGRNQLVMRKSPFADDILAGKMRPAPQILAGDDERITL